MTTIVTVCHKCGAARMGNALLVHPAYGCDGSPAAVRFDTWEKTANRDQLTDAGRAAISEGAKP